MSTHKNRVKMTVSGTPGTGTITLSAASSGYQSFATAYGANATVDILIEEGTAWEVARDCTYTNSGTTVTRGTLEASSTGSAVSFTSAAVVSVIATADRGRSWDGAALNTQVAGTDADTTMAVNTLYTVDMSAWATADRTYTLPATAAVGDRIGVMVTAGDASHELLITAASGDTLNGIAGGTEWSRLFITNEVVIMRSVAANATWVVEYDGRIPQQCDMQLTTSADGEAVNTFTRPTAAATPGAWTAQIDNASLAVVASDRINARRGGNFNCIVSGRSKDAPATGKYFNVALYKNAGATLVLLAQAVTSAAGQNPLAPNARLIPLAADDYLVFQYRNQDGGLGCQADQSWFSIQEVLRAA